MKFSSEIISWYQKNKRDLPWRKTRDPYIIWLSEIILQQTRVDQGMEYFKSFCSQFPDIKRLAAAKEEEVLKLWQGLGYYSRARNLHKTAQMIADHYNGIFPDSYDMLIVLPGIGPYTASAIASFAFNKIYPVIDGNVMRVLSRFFGINDPIDTSAGQVKVAEKARLLIDKNEPGLFNQAIMELGALVCKPQQPHCHKCPLTNECVARQQENAETYPVKSKTIKIRIRYFQYLFFRMIIKGELYTLINKRKGNDIWKNLYDFPLVESATPIDIRSLQSTDIFTGLIKNNNYQLSEKPDVIIHKLTHQHIHARFFIITTSQEKGLIHPSCLLVPVNMLFQYPIPKLIENFLKRSGIKIK